VAVQGRAQDFVDVDSDLVIANIHYDVIKRLIASKGFFRKKWFIISGLLRSQARDIVAGLSNNSITIINKWEHEGVWHTFFGKNA
jgi:ribosomal protein L11 methyltransferase